jgi:aspartate kinase
MVVQKFGGTSVADPEAIRRLIEIVRAARTRDARGPAVVVSAMSRVTDGLLGVADSAGASHLAEALSKTQLIRERHIATARELVSSSALDPLVSHINAELDDLTDVIKALAVLREVSPRTLDVVAAVGELLSSRIVAAALTSAGVDAEWVDARQVIVTNNEHTRATPLGKETNDRLRSIVGPILDSGRVAVLGGFVGATLAGHTTTLGRGGSDYSGALVGAGVEASEIQIWTDVDGMLSADPRVITRAKLVDHLSFAEAAELAYFGAKVLHPSTILPAVERNIPVRILNSWKPAAAGTLITGAGSSTRKGLTGLASKRDVTVIDITSTRMLAAYGFLRQVFEVFERFTTAVDMVTTSEVSVSVTVDDIRHLDEIEEALSEFASVSVERNMSLLCAVGDVLQHEPEMAARVVGVFEEVPLRMISQAASRRNITVVLRQGDLPHAMERLHEEFFS